MLTSAFRNHLFACSSSFGNPWAPAAYRCVGCGAVGEHWFVDCDRNEEWRRQQMEKKTRGDLFVEEVDGDRWLNSKPKAWKT